MNMKPITTTPTGRIAGPRRGRMAHHETMAPDVAIGYVRVSTEEQSKHGVSLDAQEARIRAYCELHGLRLAEIVRDEGVSASIELKRRPGGARLLEVAEQLHAKNLIGVKMDRFFRNLEDSLRQTKAWDKAGYAMHIIDAGDGQSLNTKSAMGRFFFQLTNALAEMERNLISERTQAALQHKRATRQKYTGTPPLGYGYDVQDKLVEIPEELALAKRIRALRVDRYSYHQIAHHLNEQGYHSKSGGKFYAASVREVVLNDHLYPK
ncbi:MAG: recombinase family protein [Armatimonadota bacterium]